MYVDIMYMHIMYYFLSFLPHCLNDFNECHYSIFSHVYEGLQSCAHTLWLLFIPSHFPWAPHSPNSPAFMHSCYSFFILGLTSSFVVFHWGISILWPGCLSEMLACSFFICFCLWLLWFLGYIWPYRMSLEGFPPSNFLKIRMDK
jgi:hypothetical protein